MNHEQWEALKAATQGHTPGPWEWNTVGTDSISDIELCAAAPDLLAEVERLRGWIEYISDNPRGGHATYTHAQDALNGMEVPK